MLRFFAQLECARLLQNHLSYVCVLSMPFCNRFFPVSRFSPVPECAHCETRKLTLVRNTTAIQHPILVPPPSCPRQALGSRDFRSFLEDSVAHVLPVFVAGQQALAVEQLAALCDRFEVRSDFLFLVLYFCTRFPRHNSGCHASVLSWWVLGLA